MGYKFSLMVPYSFNQKYVSPVVHSSSVCTFPAVSVAGTLQLSSTWQPVLGVVGEGSPSSPGKKLYKIPSIIVHKILLIPMLNFDNLCMWQLSLSSKY